ncbi:molybdenum cofactor guanylyltransferase [Nocardiopsis alkaliphila]|uniref:molybdenum cofactor guanylyltransferase n=1 Tax=Nocardiopsis alkaliphila TaxID=225762 RepID=UPI000381CF4F|nr:molybdenum cofactor guanylyltransferase [Nocardiopsis alkaliphila]
MSEHLEAVVLAGGAASRMGGADKPGLTIAGRTLLEHVVAAVRDHAPHAHVTVVGPRRRRPRAHYVREDPPGGGPVPALRTGLARVRAPWFVLLAADLPYLRAHHLVALEAAVGNDGSRQASGAVSVDTSGRPQWLTGLWHTVTVRAALAEYSGRSLHKLLRPLDPVHVALGTGSGNFDVDTPEDLDRARAALEDPTGG